MSERVVVQDQLHDAPLLVGEERGQRVVHVAVKAVQQADHLGEVGALNALGGLRGKGLEGGRILRLVGFDRGGDVLIAKVQHGKGEALLLAGDGADDLHPAQGEPSATGAVHIVGVAPDAVAEEVGLLGEGGEDRADGVVSRNLLQSQLLCGDLLQVDFGAVAGCGHVGVGLGHAGQKGRLERRGLLAEDLSRQLQHARGVGDDLHRFDAGDIVEEPAATGVHELGVALHLHQFQGAYALRHGEDAQLVLAEESLHGLRAVVEHGLDIFVARLPDIFEELGALGLRQRDQSVAQLVQRLAQRRAPGLIPASMAAVAAAVGAPALDAVNAAPGGVFDDLSLVFGGKLLQKTAVVGQIDGGSSSSSRSA